MEKSLKTKKGSELPLLNLKGKSYLQVAHRLLWLSDDNENYTIDTEFLLLTDDQTVAKATINLFDKDGKVVRRATATKRETKKDFSDHTEKAETGACGRALAMLGLGTQHALSDLDEGQRLADAPVQDTRVSPPVTSVSQPKPVANVAKATTPVLPALVTKESPEPDVDMPKTEVPPPVKSSFKNFMKPSQRKTQ